MTGKFLKMVDLKVRSLVEKTTTKADDAESHTEHSMILSSSVTGETVRVTRGTEFDFFPGEDVTVEIRGPQSKLEIKEQP